MGTNPEQYQVYTIAGLNGPPSGSGSPFQKAYPTVVGHTGGLNLSNYSITGTLEYGLTTIWVKDTSNNSSIGSVAFLMEPGTAANSNSSQYSIYNSGTQPIDLIPIDDTTLPQDPLSTVGEIESSSSGGLQDPSLSVNPPGGVQICMVSGGTNQSGLITIGDSSGSLLVSLSLKDNMTCS